MTAPAGWHLQPDGRERYWDGERWTDEFRDPSSAPTQEIPLDHTRGMPTAHHGDEVRPAPRPQEYAAPASSYRPPPPHREAYPREPYYEGPGGPLSDRPGSTPGWMKGCLGFLVALVIIAVIGLVAAVWWINRGVTEGVTPGPTTATTAAPESTQEPTEGQTAVPPGLPTGFPTGLPTGFPTSLPTDLPSVPGQGASAEVAPGEGFTLGPAEIQPGWSVEDAALGFKTVTMRATPTETSRVPLVFTLTFLEGGTELASTVCTVALADVGQAADVSCLPMRTDVAPADTARAEGMGG